MSSCLVIQTPQSTADLRELVVAARSEIQVTIGIWEDVAESNPDLLGLATRVFPTTVLTAETALEVAAQHDAVLTTSDSEVERVDLLQAAMGQPVLPGRWNKAEQRTFLAPLTTGSVAARKVNGAAELAGAVIELGLPLVVKPVRGAGGAGVFILNDQDDAMCYASRVMPNGPVVVERLLDLTSGHPSLPGAGNMISLEFASVGGQHHLMAIFAKFPVQFVATTNAGSHPRTPMVCGDIFPSHLAPEVAARAEAVVRQALSLLGVRNQVTHTEVLLTSSGPTIVEVNGRLGGFLSRLTRLASGYDLVVQTLRASIGVPPEPPPMPFGFAAGFFPSFDVQEGVVRSTVGVDDLRRIDGVLGVETAARNGDLRSQSAGQACNITVFQAAQSEFMSTVVHLPSHVRELYAADFRSVE